MKYDVISVGKVKTGFYREGCSEYEKRLRRYADLSLTTVREGTQEVESERLLAQASGYIIALDERGKQRTTTNLATHFSNLEMRGINRISLLIGGADGHTEQLRKQADELLSLSALTMPHDLALLVLLEQLYRVETVRAGHPYHRAN